MHQKYKIKKGDTLIKISEELGLSVDALKGYHNRYCGLNELIGGDKLPKDITEIIIPLDIDNYKQKQPYLKEGEEEVTDMYQNLDFETKARYRCEQVNVSNVNGNMSHFAEQKYQYKLQQNLQNFLARVKQEEHIYRFEPNTLNFAVDFLSKTDFIKNNVLFQISKENGKVEKILNKKEMTDKWEKFKNNDFEKDDFIIKLKKTSPYAVQELKTMGDKQFSTDYKQFEEEYRRDLFFSICFDSYLVNPVEEIQNEQFLYLSTIVPPVIVPLEFRYDKISEENGLLKIRKVGSLKLTDELKQQIEQKYNEIHKPNIKFNFTEYKLEFRVRLEFNLEDRLVETAELFIMEQVADNIDATCQYNLKRLHNYTA